MAEVIAPIESGLIPPTLCPAATVDPERVSVQSQVQVSVSFSFSFSLTLLLLLVMEGGLLLVLVPHHAAAAARHSHSHSTDGRTGRRKEPLTGTSLLPIEVLPSHWSAAERSVRGASGVMLVFDQLMTWQTLSQSLPHAKPVRSSSPCSPDTIISISLESGPPDHAYKRRDPSL